MTARSPEALERKRLYRREHYLKNREKSIACAKAWHQNNRERWMLGRRIHRKKLRQAIFDKYGNKCAKCSFSDPRALQVDHVNGSGREERKLFSNGSTPAYLRKILADTSDMYQLLCANCNWIKYWVEEANKPPTHRV